MAMILFYAAIDSIKKCISFTDTLIKSIRCFFAFNAIEGNMEWFYLSESIVGYFMLGALISMMQNNKDLIDIHKRHGFVDITEETVKVWDPFGIKRNVIVSIVNELEIDNKDHQLIEQDNVLIHFRFEDKAAEIVKKRISPKE